MKTLNIALLGIFSFFLLSCGTQSTVTTDIKALEGVWNLQNDGQTALGIGNNPITLVFDRTTSENISGFSGCNNYGAKATGTKGYITFSNMHSTKMACPNLDLEQDYLDLLQQVNRYEIKRNDLYFYQGKLLLLHYKK